MPTVAVLGAGMCGLTGIKACLEGGLQVTCYEQDGHIGGLWRFSESEGHSSVYRSTCINTGRDVNGFGDFPIPSDWPPCLHHSYMYRYLTMYAEHFKLMDHIKFNTFIEAVEPVDAETEGSPCRWEVTVRSKEGVISSVVYDYVMVTSGHHSKPRIPDFPGRDTFQGDQVHSHSYKHSDPFKGKAVVVVGIGNSGADIVTEISKVATKTHLVSRRGTWVFPNWWATGKAEVFGRADTQLMGYMPRTFTSMALEGTFVEENRLLCESGLKPAHRLTQAHPTLTLNCPQNNLLDVLRRSLVKVKKGVKRLDEKGVYFTDGTYEEVDSVVYCTGYRYEHPFLKGVSACTDTTNEVSLWRYMYVPDHRYRSLSFIGLVQPVGSMVMIAENQTRYAVWMIKNGWPTMPHRGAMLAHIGRRRATNQEWYVDSPRHTIQVCVAQYLDELGDDMGTTPTFARLLFNHPRALLAAWFLPSTNASYRLVGPGRWKGARAAMWAEYKVLYKNSPSRTIKGMLKRLLIFLLLLVLAPLVQGYNLVTKGRIEYHQYV